MLWPTLVSILSMFLKDLILYKIFFVNDAQIERGRNCRNSFLSIHCFSDCQFSTGLDAKSIISTV